MTRLPVLVFSIMLIFSVVPLALAENPPVPQSKTRILGTLKKNLKEEQRKKEELAKQVRTLEGQLERTRGKLVSVAGEVQKSEKTLKDLENRIEQLEKKQSNIQEGLHKDRADIARLILALERIERVPPEALLARPEAPYKTAQSAMLMSNIIPVLHKHAETLRSQLEELDKVSEDLHKKREDVRAATNSLKKEHDKLATLAKKREELYTRTHEDYKQREKEVREISMQAKNLEDLINRLDEKRTQDLNARRAYRKRAYTAVPTRGRPHLPIQGYIVTHYDEPDIFGAPSKGLTIEGRSGSLVVAPMGGVVRFTGPFKRFGNLIILEHQNGYHSLIAGLKKIDTVVGQSVSAGEPLGSLKYEGKPSLYYELRLGGKPVNPASVFAELS